jgi:hypothetical protein
VAFNIGKFNNEGLRTQTNFLLKALQANIKKFLIVYKSLLSKLNKKIKTTLGRIPFLRLAVVSLPGIGLAEFCQLPSGRLEG